MPSERRNYGKRMFLGLAGSPWVLLPMGAGFTAVMADWGMTGGAGALAFAGLTGVAVGVGALITRWLTRSEGLAELAQAEFEAEQRREHEQRFDRLDRRLRRDGDGRTNQALATFRELENRLAGFETHEDHSRQPPVEVCSKVRELLRSSVKSLERSVELHETEGRVVTEEARQRVRDARQTLLGEVDTSVDQIVRTLDGFYTLGLDREKPAVHLARMRQELDTSLEVARRVEERVAGLESEFGGPSRTQEDRPPSPPSL